jgi:hypothetical protein
MTLPMIMSISSDDNVLMTIEIKHIHDTIYTYKHLFTYMYIYIYTYICIYTLTSTRSTTTYG